MLRFLSLSFAAIAGFLLIAGSALPANAQRDPFGKPSWAKPRDPNAKPTTTAPNKDNKTNVKPVPLAPSPVVPPAIQERINYYKRLREQAVASNQPIPKVTSVLTLDEMAVTGIFRTPRGYAAMVEAKPIKLSYTIYPGEKFFDGQLVAIEENKLVFRRVTKWTNGKFIASEESKALRQYTVEQEVNGTAPVETTTTAKTETTTTTTTPQTPAQTPANTAENKPQTVPPAAPSQQIMSPLDEMARQPQENPKDAKLSPDKSKKGRQKSPGKTTEKKPVKVAENKQQ
ncbi:MAG: hypothetical protein M3384_14145 [Acidobacteriota bacterium]|nr:hypothetical protein [Acidobacteriota bacterium]